MAINHLKLSLVSLFLFEIVMAIYATPRASYSWLAIALFPSAAFHRFGHLGAWMMLDLYNLYSRGPKGLSLSSLAQENKNRSALLISYSSSA